MPAIHIATEISLLLEKADRWRIPDPAPGDNVFVCNLKIDGNVFTGRITERCRMHPANMRRVDKVFGNAEIIALEMKSLAQMRFPGRIFELGKIENVRRICMLRLTHPNPDYTVPFVSRIGMDLRRGWNVALARDPFANAVAAEGEAVVATDDLVLDQLTLGEREELMRATVI